MAARSKGKKKAPIKAPGKGKNNAPIKAPGKKPVPKRAEGKNPGKDVHHEVEQLLYRQAEILDSKQWQDWIDLFDEEGIYWMPPDESYKTWDGQPAIFAEDRNLMTVRMLRVLHPDAWSQRADWGTNHVVGNVQIEKAAKNDVVVRSRFHMLEMRRDDVRHFAGRYTHHLKKTKSGWRIKMQRVDMTNATAAYDYVLQVWV